MNLDRSDPGPRVAAHHAHGSGIAHIGYPIGVRTVSLARRAWVTPGMLRITLAGSGAAGLHTYQADDHVALVLPDEDGTLRPPVPAADDLLDWPRPLPRVRKYTIRRFDPVANEIDLDVVAHPGGLAASWAQKAPIGSPATLAGPPGAKAFPHTYDHYVLAADATALPALERWLRESPPHVSADVVAAVDTPAETAYPLPERDGVRVRWLVGQGASALGDAVAALPAPAGRTFLWAAGEAGALRPLRSWSRGRLDALVTGYWKRGVDGFDDD